MQVALFGWHTLAHGCALHEINTIKFENFARQLSHFAQYWVWLNLMLHAQCCLHHMVISQHAARVTMVAALAEVQMLGPRSWELCPINNKVLLLPGRAG